MSNKIIFQRSQQQRESDIFVVSDTAIPSHKSLHNAYLCDGTDDQDEIIAAYNEIKNTGGSIRLSEGSFNLTECINIDYNKIKIKGMGPSTKLIQSSEETTIIDATGTQYTEISDVWISMPTENGADGIIVGTVPKLINLRIEGGDTEHYLLSLVQSFNMHIQDITAHGAIGNGINFTRNTGTNPGNGYVGNIQFSMAENTVGINLDLYNLIQFDSVNIVTGASTGNGIQGILMNASTCIWNMIDLERLDYGIVMEEGRYNTFNDLFSTAHECDIYLGETTEGNVFMTHHAGASEWKIEDNGLRHLSRRNLFLNCNKFIHGVNPPLFTDDFVGAAISPVWNIIGESNLSNSYIILSTTASTGNTALMNFGGNGGYKDEFETYFEAKLERTTEGTYDVRFGLIGDGWEYNNHNAYFRALNTDENWQLCVSGTECRPYYDPPYVVDSGVVIDETAHTFKIHKNSYSTGVQFFIDNRWVGDLRHCMPLTTANREPVFEVITQEDAANSISIDYVLLQQGRALTP